jgi:hypothetical protein
MRYSVKKNTGAGMPKEAKYFSCLIKHNAMKMQENNEVNPFMTSGTCMSRWS